MTFAIATRDREEHVASFWLPLFPTA